MEKGEKCVVPLTFLRNYCILNADTKQKEEAKILTY